MKVIIALGVLAGSGFIWMAINEIDYRRKWRR